MPGLAGLPRAFGQGFPEQGNLKQYLAVFIRNVARGFQAILDHLDAAFAALIHRPFENTFHQIPVSTVHD